MASAESPPLRRSTRISQSNLQIISATDSACTQGSCEQVQTQSEQKTEVKSFALNKTKSLLKKLESCNKQDLDYEMKAGNNLVLKFSTAAYELATKTIVSITDSEKFRQQLQVERENCTDKDGAKVGFK